MNKKIILVLLVVGVFSLQEASCSADESILHDQKMTRIVKPNAHGKVEINGLRLSLLDHLCKAHTHKSPWFEELKVSFIDEHGSSTDKKEDLIKGLIHLKYDHSLSRKVSERKQLQSSRLPHLINLVYANHFRLEFYENENVPYELVVEKVE